MFDFENKDQILTLIQNAENDSDTTELLNYFKSVRSNRHKIFITEVDLEKILVWKLRGQYGRQKSKRIQNTDKNIQKISKLAFEIEHPEEQYEIKLKLNLLSCLNGIGVPVASAILALIFPEKYGVIDFRVWHQLFGEEKKFFTDNDYFKYLNALKALAQKYDLNVQQIDLALWQLNRETSKDTNLGF